MLTLYIVSAAVAGVLILLSLLGIGHDHEGHVEMGANIDHDVDHSLVGWIPFFSLRFYTYFFSAFGTAGLLLHYYSTTPDAVGVWLAAAVGLVSGLGVWIVLKLLRRSEGSSSATERDVLGKEGQVLVAINGSSPGRIRCSVRGDIIDFLAVSDWADTIPAGTSIVVVAMEHGRAQVMPREAIFSDDSLVQRI